MSSGVALPILLGIVALGSGIGFYAAKRQAPSLEEWAVGGRGFGLILVWLLQAGEIFTTFSLLGISGWIYSRGAPVLYALAYLTLAQVVWFHVGPAVWEMGRRHRLQTLPDFFAQRYGGRTMPMLVAAFSIVAIIVYLQLQLTGLGIIVSVASADRIPRAAAMGSAAVLVAGFVFTSGIRGVAWVSVLKDALLTIAAIAVGFGLPYIHFGGIGPMFAALKAAKPAHLVMPGSTPNLGHAWYMSSVLLSCLGYAWPHLFASSFTAKSGDVIRRNSIIMPVYCVALFLIVFAGCAAILVVPDLKNGDLALLTAVQRSMPAWFLGVLGGAGVLTAMVPSAILILTAATLLAKNLWRPGDPRRDEQKLARLARMSVIVFTAVALGLALNSSATLVALLLMAYGWIGQFFPGIVFGVFWPRASRAGIMTGMVVGLATGSILIGLGRDPFLGMNAGFVGLVLNFVVAIAVTLFAPGKESTP